MLELTDNTFDDAISKVSGLVLLDCYSENCAPCKALEPALDKLQAEFSGQVTFFKLNVVDNPELMGRFSLFSVPTLLFIVKGKPVAEIIGAFPEKTIRLKIRSLLEDITEA
ncbi:MAG: thiol reductase thioredoxin [Acidobacteria bacterium]|nr:MAG: thiol reductase thioredoxin [Acidobacteriota bacterium]RLE24348.1 MAG: thiol reductase thioredoxin [Acidobacteriota bacterium]